MWAFPRVEDPCLVRIPQVLTSGHKLLGSMLGPPTFGTPM